MLASSHSKRSFRSLKSLVSFYGQADLEETFAENADQESRLPTPPPSVLHLPPSVVSTEDISPTLWNWIKADDFHKEVDSTQQLYDFNSIKVIAYSGQILPFPPQHLLLDPQQLTSKGADLSRSKSLGRADGRSLVSSSTANTRRALPRKPISSSELALNKLFNGGKVKNIGTIPRFFIQLRTIKLKSNSGVTHIYCKVQVGTQRFFTKVVTCVRESGKGYGLSVTLNEAFMFDMPNDRDEFTVIVHLFSAPAPAVSQMAGSLSMEGLDSRQAPIKRLMRRQSTMISNVFNSSHINHQTNGGKDVLVGELSFSLPTRNEFPKVTGSYSFGLNGKKEISKCTMQMGLLLDEEYNRKQAETPLMEYINFCIQTSTYSIWKKYWCIFYKSIIEVYDFEYKQDRPAIGYIPINQIKRVKVADGEDISTENTLEIQVSSKFVPWTSACAAFSADGVNTTKTDRSDMNDSEWEFYWKNSLVQQKFDYSGPSTLVIYAMTETSDGFRKWQKEFKENVNNV